MKEIWKDVLGYEGYYKVSNNGSIKSLKKGILIKPWLDGRGYPNLYLCKNGKKEHAKVGRVVMQAFFGYSKLEVNHLDYNPRNNRLDNLEYCTRQENMAYSVHNIKKANCGEGNRHAKLKNEDVIYIRKNYKSFLDMGYMMNKFNISKRNIQRIVKKDIWCHI